MLAEGRCSPTAKRILSSHRLVMRVTQESCTHEGSLADLGMRLCGLLAEVTGPSDEYWRNREATRDAISQVSALHEHLPSVDTRRRRFTRNWRYRRMREGSLSERELNSHVCDLRRCSPVQVCKRIAAGQGHGFVSEDQGLPITHASDVVLTTAFALGGAR